MKLDVKGERGWGRGALTFFAVATALYYACPPVADNDLWGHVLFGRVMLETAGLPATNGYSYVAPDHPWINHEILAECAFAFVFDRFGSPGLLVLKLLIGVATIGFVLRAIARRTDSPASTAIALILCGALVSPGFLVRPQLFTYLGLAWLWQKIDTHDRSNDWRALASAPVLFALWINTHGGVVAGLGILLAYLAVKVVSAEESAERLRLAFLGAVSSLSLLLNPYGVGLLTFLWHDVRRTRWITEWQAIDPFGSSGIICLAVIAVIAGGALVTKRPRTWEALILSLTAVMTFRHHRHLPLFAIVSAPLLAERLAALGERARVMARLPEPSAGFRAAIAVGLCAIGVFEIYRVQAIYRSAGLNILVPPDVFPVDSVRFIKENALRGNLAVPFDWGEYAIWHLHPDCRVSIDGRYTTAYPDEALDSSHKYQTGEPGWEASLRGADLALLERRQPIVRAMLADDEWQYVYSDPIAFVFVRKSIAAGRTFVRNPRTGGDKPFYFP